MSDPHVEGQEPEPGLSPWRKAILGLLVLVFLGSLGARAMLVPEPTPAGVSSELARGLLPGAEPAPAQPEPEGLEAALPFLTEGSFFGLIGFAVGYASRKVVKLALLMIALFFVVLQVLVYQGLAEVDWGALIRGLNDLVFNLKENRTLTEVLTDRVPTAGAFVAGYVFGFQRG